MLYQATLTLLPLGMLSSSVLVVTAASPVLSVLFVVALFLLSALYMVLAGLPFVGLVYLVVYVGAVAVLFLFVVMMLNVPLSAYGGNEQAVPLQALLVSLFLLVYVLSGSDSLRGLSGLSQSADSAQASLNQAQSLASALFAQDALLLMLVGVVLLLSMVGPVSMSVDHNTEGQRQLQAQASLRATPQEAL